MRTVKNAEERRNEILDAAAELFKQKGFDGTSTGDILEKVGIARGTLYYHFKSKEDIMDALIGRLSSTVLDSARKIAADRSLPVRERMLRAVRALNIEGGSEKEIMDQLHRPQNALMHRKMEKSILAGVTPILSGIVEEGIAEGLLETPYPYECVEMVVTYASAVFDDEMIELSGEERASRARALLFNIERLFGAESGSLGELSRLFGPSSEARHG